MSKLPKVLILAFEPGTNALNNTYVQPIEKWADFKSALRQLKSDAMKDKFDFIGIDTADIAWDLCVKYICQREDVETLGDIAWGKGFDMCKKEYQEAFRTLALYGYGICFVSHSAEKTFKDEKGEDYTQLVPALPNRPYDIVNKMVDIIGYIRNVRNKDTGEQKTFLFLRGDDRFLAGSRFKYIEPRIEFSYDSLANAIYDAIDKQNEEDGVKATDDGNAFYQEKEEGRTYEEAIEEARTLWEQLLAKNPDNIKKINASIQNIFGKKIKLSEVLPNQVDLLELVIEDMKEIE